MTDMGTAAVAAIEVLRKFRLFMGKRGRLSSGHIADDKAFVKGAEPASKELKAAALGLGLPSRSWVGEKWRDSGPFPTSQVRGFLQLGVPAFEGGRMSYSECMIGNDKTIRVGLIGYGYAGKTFHAPLIHSVPGLALQCYWVYQSERS